MNLPTGHVFWIFGLSGAGKSTVAEALVSHLRGRGVPTLALDGDTVRGGLCAGLGFSEADREENLRRSAHVARLAVESRLCVVAAFITPLEANRQMIRQILGPEAVSFVFADSPLEVCRGRDVKGLYAKAQAGLVPRMTGVAAAFERPQATSLVLNTAAVPPESSVRSLIAFVEQVLALP